MVSMRQFLAAGRETRREIGEVALLDTRHIFGNAPAPSAQASIINERIDKAARRREDEGDVASAEAPLSRSLARGRSGDPPRKVAL
jgi:hypothetical protein